jgi:6-phosphogluconate dehydrogenase (decarboxylating)
MVHAQLHRMRLMAAYAEGFNTIKHAHEGTGARRRNDNATTPGAPKKSDIDLGAVAEVWRCSVVTS